MAANAVGLGQLRQWLAHDRVIVRPVFDPAEAGPPGRTEIGNLGGLGRRHHLAKTFDGVEVQQPVPGTCCSECPPASFGCPVMTPTTSVGITGATGHIGGATARHLTEAGLSTRLLVRDPARAPSLPGADVRQAAYGDPAAVDALRGVDTLLMVSGAESDDRVGEHRAFVEAAVKAGVRHVVYTSFVGAGHASGFLLGRDHGATEEIIGESGLAYTFLRDNFYAEVFPYFADEDGAIKGPAGDGRVAAVSRRDVSEVAALVLQDPERHAGATYDLTGPTALSLDEVATVLSELTGRPHRFVDETMEEARASRAHYGAPDWLVDAWISTYTAIRDGELEAVSEDIPRLLGRPATSFVDAVRDARP